MVKSRSEQYLTRKGEAAPSASPLMVKSVSQHRRESLEGEIDAGSFSKGYSDQESIKRIGADPTETTPLGHVVGSNVISKKAQSFVGSFEGNQGGGSTGNGYRGLSGTLRQTPEVYSPLWLNSNLNLPRDRATINAWSRSFFALNPIVQNAISLHSTYPISKLNIKCKNPQINAFFENMIDEIDLMNVCVQLAQEYWTLGEAFVYAELDEGSAKWSRLLIQNPDYMVVKKSVIAGEPVISLRPDENLRRIVTSNRAADLQQRQQLDPNIVEHVRRGENIPLSNFYISHIARKISPYEIRGTGLPVSCFRQLMLFDKLRECHSFDTQVLTSEGFKYISEITEITDKTHPNQNYVNGISLNNDGSIAGTLVLKDNIKVACFNLDNKEIEYHIPEEFHMSRYKGEMYHFTGKKVDCLVSPNHKMLVKENGADYKLIKANELYGKHKSFKFISKANWSGKTIENVNVCGKEVPTDLYMKVLGYIASEGWVYFNNKNGRYDRSIGVSQLTSSDCYDDMKDSFCKFASIFNKKVSHCNKVAGSGYSKDTPKSIWNGRIHDKELVLYFIKEIGNGKNAGSFEKRIPRWIFDLSSKHLSVLLDALVKGDGTESISKYGTGSKNYKYSTVSKQLADDVYELAYKCGYVPNICVSEAKKTDNRIVKEYIVMWSDTNYGNEPNVTAWDKPRNGNGGGAVMKKVNYEGDVWCFTVPTGLFITRRNGKITIQGNSKFAQADNMINPLTLVKVGGGADNYKPTPADLELWRQIFEECHDEDTEVLTDQGFMKFDEAIEISNLLEATSGTVSKTISRPKPGVKVACFNPDTDKLEYHEPLESHIYDYSGEMYHFHNDKMDIKVTPNHKMWVQSDNNWRKVRAKDMRFFDSKFRTGNTIESITVDVSLVNKEIVNKVQYNGKVWCFTVPTGLFVTRRNGKITIQGNSQYDKDFKIFTHDGVTVDRVGYNQGIYDISGDITQLLKEIYIGLMVPQVIMDGGADVTYANGGVALDVLRQRYMQFRNMISSWLRRKIFAPISKINDFYDYKDKEKVLIVPEVEWNHMSLFDMGDYIQNISQLISQEPRKVSLQTLYRSLGLEYEDEVRKIRRETIDQVIQAKEMEALQRMSLNDLRSVGEEDEIQEIQESPLPGENPYGPAGQQAGGMGGGMGDMGGGLGGGLGGGISGPPLGGGGLGGPPLGGGTPPMGGGGGEGAPPPPTI